MITLQELEQLKKQKLDSLLEANPLNFSKDYFIKMIKNHVKDMKEAKLKLSKETNLEKVEDLKAQLKYHKNSIKEYADTIRYKLYGNEKTFGKR